MTLPLRASADDRRPFRGDALSGRSSDGESFSDRGRTLVRRRRRAPRRGIILLMSLSLLTLFLMMLVTLIVITGQYRQSARVQARVDRVGDPPHKITDVAIKNVLIGSGSTASSIHGHELLRDLYGESWRGVIGVNPVVHPGANPNGVFLGAPGAEPLRTNPGSTSSFLTFEFRRPSPTGYFDLYANTTPGDYTGCLVTFIGGPVRKNVSVRILEYVPPTSSSAPDCFVGRFTVARSNPDDTEALPDAATLSAALSSGDVTFLVNERPLSGYGAGYGPIPDPDPSGPMPRPPAGTWGYNITRQGAQDFVYQGTAGQTQIPAVLVPHYRTYDDAALTLMGAGGLNEDYDAVDFQNMFLASVPPGAQRADQIVPSFWRPELVNYWRHFTFDHDGDGDPADLVSLWYQEGSPAGSRIANDYDTAVARNNFYRRLFLRPLPTDHPEFTGSNPDAALPLAADHMDRANMAKRLWQPLSLLTGSNDINEDNASDDPGAPSPTWPPMPDTDPAAPPLVDPVSDVNANGIVDQWDVDNDGDGLTDSIWIDIGLPVQRMEDGKLYKPLVAYLIRDLDGLANVNAHMHPDSFDADPSALSGPLAGTVGANPVRQRGLGYGPTELGFPTAGFSDTGFGDDLFSSAQLERLVAARYYDGRPGRDGVNDLLSRLRSPSLPPFIYNSATVSEWGTPPDAWGTQSIGLDYLGQPWNDRVAVAAVLPPLTPTTPDPRPQLLTHLTNAATPVSHPTGPTEGLDDPYEIDLYTVHAAAAESTLGYETPDTPYTLSELERILRWNDSDASFLPGRLATEVSPAFDDIARRRSVTTLSSHIPAAPSAVPSELRAPGRQHWSLYHLLFEKVSANAGPASGAPFPAGGFVFANLAHRNWVDNEVRKMMPWELWHGMKMDLNRRWQNGFDDNGNGIVDEPGEVNVPETVFPNNPATSAYGLGEFPAAYNQQFDHLGADPQLVNPILAPFARQIFARHLYCTALLLMDYDHDGPDSSGTLNGFDPRTAFQDTELTTNWDRANEIFKRRLAQWAINVVEYRDADAICSPFEYDMNPANGWQADIDGHPGTVQSGERRIVWGVEAPHLLISETLALHNRRVIDSNRDDGNQRTRSSMPTADPHLDQHRVPQGSLFVELFGVGNRIGNDAHTPRELYTADGQLELDKTAPGGAGVWRLAISEKHEDDDTTAYRRAEDNTRPESTSFDPQDLNLLTLTNPSLDAGGEEVVIPTYPAMVDPTEDHRYVYFTSALPPAGAGADNTNTFYRRSAGPTRVVPGGYLVVAPRTETYLSLREDGDTATRPANGQAKIAVNATTLENYGNFDDAGTHQHPAPASFGTQIPTPQAVICAADPPSSWSTVTTPVGLNISEPLPQSTVYYTEPTHGIITDGVRDGYAQWDGTTPTLPDQPFDDRTGRPLTGMTETMTTPNWRTIFLQRLANPLEVFHPLQNPYITVDFSPLAISVFNGDDRYPSPYNGPDPWDPQDVNHDGPDDFDDELRFGSQERGQGKNRPVTGTAWQNYYPVTGGYNDDDFLLWPHQFALSPQTRASAPGAAGILNETEYRHNLVHTLGYLNVNWGMEPAVTGYMPPRPDYLGAPPALPPGGGGRVYSFPWLNWADRPLATPLELMTIPHSSQASWFEDWSLDRLHATGELTDAYDVAASGDASNFRGFYGHLLNFFHGAQAARGPSQTAATGSPRMYRLFDYVETPSPFAGSREFFHTANMNRAPGFLRSGNSYLSRFRDPGRMNLNTMPKELWSSFNYALPDNRELTPDEFDAARQGFAGTEYYRYPTRIVRPFREANKADLAPLLPGSGAYLPERLQQNGVEATLLRTESPGTATEPFFAESRQTQQYQHTDRNPYFRYEQLARLPNLTSTHSNAYAVWVTVGYFEAHRTSPVLRNVVPAADYAGQPLPDGVWLGQEIGADTGRNRRHRAFYIIDRSIPAAFEPGNDHNAEKTILLRRYLD